MYMYDVLIVGSGLAGWTVARSLSKTKRVAILSKETRWSSNSMLAQGGIAAVFSKIDNWASHYNDTIKAGCYHNDEEAVKYLVKKGPPLIRQLIRSGMQFDCNEQNEIMLGREGAHTHRRILHAGGDATGKALVTFLNGDTEPHVDMIEYSMVQELIIEDGRCIGVLTRNRHEKTEAYYAQHIVLATGGCGSLYQFSSNSPTVVGDGISLAYRAGAELTDLEFIQFHPTLLVSNGKSAGLVSEAVRGEGAVLVNEHGAPIMDGVHELEDLAPRDVVAREIFRRIKNGEEVFLSIKNVKNFTSRFPTITALCRQNNININTKMIPVMPGAHFHMGGVKVNMYGETTIPRLYAVGETACTGVHGANRLASNSLLEGIVFGELAARNILEKEDEPIFPIPAGSVSKKSKIELPSKQFIQKMMMDHVGIVRNKSSLTATVQLFGECLSPIDHFDLSGYSYETVELIHMLTAAYVIAKSALEREESRGAHFRSDFPGTDNLWLHRKIIQQNSAFTKRKLSLMKG